MNNKQFKIRTSVLKPKQMDDQKYQFITNRTKTQIIKEKCSYDQNANTPQINEMKIELFNLNKEIKQLRQYKDRYQDLEQKNTELKEIMRGLDRELKKRDNEIDHYLDKIDSMDSQIKDREQKLRIAKAKKKEYKNQVQRLRQQAQQQNNIDPFSQLLEMRSLLLQMRLTTQLLPLIANQQRLGQFQQQPVDVDNMSYEQLLLLEEQMGVVNNGISREDIRKIPKRIVHPNDNFEDLCTVCQCNLETGQKYRKLGCNHFYHSKCIKDWLLTHNNCPVCKQAVQVEQHQN